MFGSALFVFRGCLIPVPGLSELLPGLAERLPGRVAVLPGWLDALPGLAKRLPGRVTGLPDSIDGLPGRADRVPGRVGALPDESDRVLKRAGRLPVGHFASSRWGFDKAGWTGEAVPSNMKTPSLVLLMALFASLAVAQEVSPTPKFAGGHTTGDAANGGPVGNNELPGDSQSTAVAPATPTPTPSATPSATPRSTPSKP